MVLDQRREALKLCFRRRIAEYHCVRAARIDTRYGKRFLADKQGKINDARVCRPAERYLRWRKMRLPISTVNCALCPSSLSTLTRLARFAPSLVATTNVVAPSSHPARYAHNPTQRRPLPHMSSVPSALNIRMANAAPGAVLSTTSNPSAPIPTRRAHRRTASADQSIPGPASAASTTTKSFPTPCIFVNRIPLSMQTAANGFLPSVTPPGKNRARSHRCCAHAIPPKPNAQALLSHVPAHPQTAHTPMPRS